MSLKMWKIEMLIKKLLLDFQFQSFHFLGKLCIKSSLEVDSNTPSMLCDNVKEKKRFFLTFINHKDYNHIGVNVEENCGAYHTELALGDVTCLAHIWAVSFTLRLVCIHSREVIVSANSCISSGAITVISDLCCLQFFHREILSRVSSHSFSPSIHLFTT